MPSLAANSARPIFVSSGAVAGEAGGAYVAQSGSAKLLAARLSLKGIVAGAKPQAIIEDSQTQKTYFATKGQAVAEGAVVVEVQDNSAVLDLGGEKIELTL
jgi:hypothetical protein